MRHQRRARIIVFGILAICLALPGWFVFSTFRQMKRDAALLVAVKADDVDGVERLLQEGADPNVRQPTGKPPTAWEYLLQRLGRKKPASKGPTALTQAIEQENPTIARLLLEHGANTDLNTHINGPDPNRFADYTPLIWACEHNYLPMARLLLDRSADTNLPPGNPHLSPLMIAVREGNRPLAEMLLRRGTNMTDTASEILLWEAILSQHEALISLLLAYGASPTVMPMVQWITLGRRISPTILELLLKSDVNVHTIDSHGKTVLMLAAELAVSTNVRLLLKYTDNINARDHYGNTALDYAISRTDPERKEIIRLLKQSGAQEGHASSLSARNPQALIEAVYHEDESLVRKLLAGGIKVNTKDGTGETALMWAIKRNNSGLAKLLLRYGANVNAQNIEGRTALRAAAETGNTEIVRILLDRGAKVNVPNVDGDTALVKAVEGEHTEVARLLLTHGADIPPGAKLLMLAAESGNTDLAAHLLAHGADIQAVDDSRYTALMGAAAEGHAQTVRFLIARGAEVNHVDEEGGTALMVAASSGDRQSVQTLLDAGANINTLTYDGHTALMYAIDPIGGKPQNNAIDIVRLLLAHDAAPNDALRDTGETPLILAADRGDAEIVRMLLAAGANIKARDHKHQTALMHAQNRGHDTVVALLRQAGARR